MWTPTFGITPVYNNSMASPQKRPDVHGRIADESIDQYQPGERVEVPPKNTVKTIDQLK